MLIDVDKKWKAILAVTILIVICAGPSFAQYGDYFQPRTILGGDVAQFRISLDTFENVYQDRWGPSYGGFVGVRAFSAHYIMLKYGTFEKDGKTGIHPVSDLPLENAHWDEKWYSIGLRISPPIMKKNHSYYGFGISFFDVDELKNLSVFNQSSQNDDDGLGSGFYLELGMEYFLINRVAAFFEMQIASGGVKGKTGFEAMSIGGFRFALGITIFPF
jgi:hypothetical protein